MSKDKEYYFHQTPNELAKDLISKVPITNEDVLFEPFKGENAFFSNFPDSNVKLWSEITEGKDFRDVKEEFDWVITNPPFKLDNGAKRVNAFWFFIDYFTQRARKGIAFLANDSCFCTLTPKRMKIIEDRGWTITKITICSVKKWRGRYFFIIFEKSSPLLISYLPNNY